MGLRRKYYTSAMVMGPEVLKVIRDQGAVDEDELPELLTARGSRLLYGLSRLSALWNLQD